MRGGRYLCERLPDRRTGNEQSPKEPISAITSSLPTIHTEQFPPRTRGGLLRELVRVQVFSDYEFS
jgi:hypothetical protein